MATKRARPRATKDTSIDRRIVERLMFGSGKVRRFTQDSPVLPDVWLEYAKSANERTDPYARQNVDEPFPPVRVLLTPFRETPPGLMAKELRERLRAERASKPWLAFGHSPETPTRICYNLTTVAATLYFEDLIRAVVPMSEWWRRVAAKWVIEDLRKRVDELAEALIDPEHAPQMEQLERRHQSLPADILWLVRVVGALVAVRKEGALPEAFDKPEKVATAQPRDWRLLVDRVYEGIKGITPYKGDALVYSVSLNREAAPTIARSTLAVKADAARRLFDISCAKLKWAIVDTGVDARHPAFRTRVDGKAAAKPFTDDKGSPRNNTRIAGTYDFTGLDLLLDGETKDLPPRLKKLSGKRRKDIEKHVDELNTALLSGKAIEWQLLEPLLRIPHIEGEYEDPPHDHGTHVAGILASEWRRVDNNAPLEEDLVGVCPDLMLYDLRVLDGRGRGDEFSVMAALQFIRYLNATSEYMVVHGVNLSLSIPHDIANYACGRTPVCNEAERLVGAGVVVVAAAGNQGYRRYTTEEGLTEVYNSISITDPGNADAVITVGATHRFRPFTYGVSYFSSRGPTGDGRIKPDLVAPGEKITAPLPRESYGLKDGTSMAAPHVSGAAALLMARYNELLGQPDRVKKILCETATDLGRERYFQGRGMLDVLRALQSV
ncbi:MAG TPA: S8 family serine peptidase [Thermoanaerobaculia bacterium]|nr:S8 family serine peptidase [Thermoanaerobaculia bacterium]